MKLKNVSISDINSDDTQQNVALLSGTLEKGMLLWDVEMQDVDINNVHLTGSGDKALIVGDKVKISGETKITNNTGQILAQHLEIQQGEIDNITYEKGSSIFVVDLPHLYWQPPTS